MNPKALIPLLVGLGVAGLAGKLGFDYLRKAGAAETKVVKLWTPVQDVPRGQAISEAMIQPLAFPLSAAPKTALADKQKLLGRVPHTGCPAGLPILDSMLLPPGAAAGINVPSGFRAVSVKVDESSGLDTHLEPESHVDVVAYFNARQNGKPVTVAKTLLEDVVVAAVGERIAPDAPTPAEAAGGKRPSKDTSKKARTVTLLVKPDAVPTIHLAEQRGKIKLSLRGANDDLTSPNREVVVSQDDILESESEVAANEPKESWVDKMTALIAGVTHSAQPAPAEPAEPAAEPEPEPGPEPQLAWVMVVYNGEDRRTLGWNQLSSTQAIELTGEAPNLFEQVKREGKNKRSPRKTGKTPPPVQNPPTPAEPPTTTPDDLETTNPFENDSTDPSEPNESTTEPKELTE